MLPVLESGDDVLVDPRAYRRGPPTEGELVVLRHPLHRDTRLVKRVGSVDSSQSTLQLFGDNPGESSDSRSFGSVPVRLVLGRVTSRLQ